MKPSPATEPYQVVEKIWKQLLQNQNEDDASLRIMQMEEAWKLWKQRVNHERMLRNNLEFQRKKNN